MKDQANDTNVNVRVPKLLKQKLEWLAKQDRRDFSDFMRIKYEDLTSDVPDDFNKKAAKKIKA